MKQLTPFTAITLFIFITFLISTYCYAQERKSHLQEQVSYQSQSNSATRTLIADETEFEELPSGKSFKIISSNETISGALISRYSKTQELKYHFQYRKDRRGYYPEYTFYFPITRKDAVLSAIPK